MHQSFTGSARKARQVNLSGRNTTNPWAALSKSGQGSSPAGNNPVAQAQADRVKRQQERDRLNASRKIQKVWRGHSTRRKEKAVLRETWDENERLRLGRDAEVDYRALVDNEESIPGYENSDQLLLQLRLLLQYQEYRRARVRDEMDTFRLLYFGQALQPTLLSLQGSLVDHVWSFNLSRLGLVVSRHLKSILMDESTSITTYGPRLLKMISMIAIYVSDHMVRDSTTYFETIELALASQKGEGWQKGSLEAIWALLRYPTQKQPAYRAFVTRLMTRPSYADDSAVLARLATPLDLTQLSTAITEMLEDEDATKTDALTTTERLWQLAYLVYFHDAIQRGSADRAYIEALSALLGECANEIAERYEQADHLMSGDNSKNSSAPLPPFVREMISRIPQQDNLQAVLDEMGSSQPSTGDAGGTDFQSAKRLANFAVALLRAFPAQAQNIRMALYRGSVKTVGNADVSTIQYFWNTARGTGVFKKITRDHRIVLSLLREAAPPSNQIGQAPVSKAEIAQWRDEWRITLLFLELYTFVLKFMDDEDFFSYDKSHSFGATTTSPISVLSRKGSLPLNDVAQMTIFLKNLAFVLYWNAAELVESNEHEEDVGISALFGGSSHSSNRQPEKKQQTLTGNGVSQGYLKGLVTGLLRMLHERDSRRSFVPPGHWLMTNQVSMAGFIPAVVAEEERRHELGEDEDAHDQQDDFDKDAELDESAGSMPGEMLLNTMFGIRPSHIPRSRASRMADRIEKQRLQARKKRQLESLAPRLEILRNLPFFIPFETRVQIFREFVYRDQLRRRDGAIDPDTWRMSVVTSTQGRGTDGRPRGVDIISRHHAEIRREKVFEDAYEAFYGLGEGLKEPIQITFIDKFGAPEAGIDGGGVTKEFLMSVTSEAFDPDASLAMFKENAQRYLSPNPLIYQETAAYLKRAGRKPGTEGFDFPMAEFLRRFQFLGRVVGKCLYEGILIDVSFAGFFLLKWALTGGTTVGSNESAYRATINDLREYDEELYQGLLKLKNYPGDVENDFGLDFTVTDTITIEDERHNEVHQTITTELIANGANTPVTNTNRLVYIDRIVRYRLQQQPKAVTDAFLKGLGQIIQPMWLAMFNQKELQKLVGGDNSELDIADLRRNTQYGGLYVIGDDGQEHPTVQLFWKALQEMSDSDRRKVLKFVTSTPRAPLLGFSHLNPRFSIRDSSEDQERLPSTSTCVNLLKLPRYGDIKTMKEKLLYAVNSGAGFDLS
ncbi:IQ and HECT domain protein [Cladophialophora carrionii]|uniref:HECT-type E3 ubiquitin transferase n=1 Tax=Cladophialophora carrionii TaxID=86049 RepID=A0A1C1CCH9_9EURO|nr:IQ and HECT domain protein [Cladophialophora carrionii]